MSAAENSRDDAEPPSGPSPSVCTISLCIHDAVDESTVPPVEQINAWVERTLQSLPTPTNCTDDNDTVRYEMSVSVVDESTIQSLNREYRTQDKPTNVLSFPSGMPLLPVLRVLGDVVVCQSVIVDEAKAQGKTLDQHWAHMLVHSVLHLFGYDHETAKDAQVMEALEIELLSELSIPNPYQLPYQNQ